jgi:hypothetical protein
MHGASTSAPRHHDAASVDAALFVMDDCTAAGLAAIYAHAVSAAASTTAVSSIALPALSVNSSYSSDSDNW